MVLVSAPAGYGKTTLLSEWCAGLTARGVRVAWLSLDTGDNDPVRFCAYVIEALKDSRCEAGDRALHLLQAPQPPSVQAALTIMLNAIAETHEPLVLVLDDYDVIQNQEIHASLDFMVNHVPPEMHLVISSRSLPPMRLARLRAKGVVTEIQVDDLRFTEVEAAAFLSRTMGIELSPVQLETLKAWTEGWVAGLQLLALSLQRQKAAAPSASILAGSRRHVLNYLAEEVLSQQPEEIQHFLLCTSILDRFTAPLCDAVTGHTGIPQLLEQLDGAGLFISRIDEEGQYYRYHPLFAELLLDRLRQTDPEMEPRLHLRACDWFEQNGWIEEAVGHALMARDFPRAARLIETEADKLFWYGNLTTLLTWAGSLSECVLHSHPRLCLRAAEALLLSGELDAADRYLRLAESRLADEQSFEDAGDGQSGIGKTDQRELRGEALACRSVLAAHRGDANRASQLSLEALTHLPPGEPYWLSAMAYVRALADQSRGRPAIAAGRFAKVAAATYAQGFHYLAFRAFSDRAYSQVQQGKLHEAANTCHEALRLAADRGAEDLPVVGAVHVVIGDTFREWNRLDQASEHLLRSVELGQQGRIPDIQRWGFLALARLRLAQRNWGEAGHAMERAEWVSRKGQAPRDGATIGAHRARLWLARGDLDAAAAWAADYDGTRGDGTNLVRDFEELTLVRVRIAEGSSTNSRSVVQQSLTRLDRLHRSATKSLRWATVIEALSLRALGLHALGDTSDGVETLQRSLELAEPQGYVRLYADEGESMAVLLSELAGLQKCQQLACSRDYLIRLLAAARSEAGSTHARSRQDQSSGTTFKLSERELEVLRLVGAGLSNCDIAERLVVTIHTAKWHIKSIISKLGVRNRTEAVARARELKLIE